MVRDPIANMIYVRRYRLKHKALGLCAMCSAMTYAGSIRCKRHLIDSRRYQRERAYCRPWRPGSRGRVPLEVKRDTPKA